MQAAAAPNKAAVATRTADIALKIAHAMRGLGVMPLPRNYEIFFEVFTGSNAELNADLAALGARPKQDDLDQISVKHFVKQTDHLFIDNVRQQIANKVEEVMILMERERLQLERYGTVLNQTSEGLSKRNTITQDLLTRITSIMTVATDSRIEQGRQIATTMRDKSTELEEVKAKLEEYKKLADTDALTQLQNRRGFDREIARIYDDPKRAIFASMILADIDRFKQLNDRFGHPVGDRIIQHVAQIVKGCAGENATVARTGGEEFAVILNNVAEDAVAQVAEQVRAAVERMAIGGAGNQPGSSGPITISLGLCMAAQASSPDELYEKADRALYVSKANGRNRVTRFSALPDLKSQKGWKLYEKA